MNGIQEVSGSIPLISTITKRVKQKTRFHGNEFFALCGNRNDVHSETELLKGVVTIAEVIAASQLISYISNPVQWLNSDLTDLKTAKIPAKKLRAILDEPEDSGGSEQLHGRGGELALRELRFAYTDREILSGVNYIFESGKKYLITGASGSGKSTLLRLIAGLRDDYRGSITLAGKDIRALSRKSLTENICEIEQEPFLFDDTLYNNICLYEDVGEDEVLEAIRRVELGGLFNTLTDGLRTPMGENAAFLSGGEKQRVVIARAIVRNTPILLLDESTSHLDPHTAAEIERMILGLVGVTVLLVWAVVYGMEVYTLLSVFDIPAWRLPTSPEAP